MERQKLLELLFIPQMHQSGRSSASSNSNNSLSNTSIISDSLLESRKVGFYNNNYCAQQPQQQNITAALLNFPNFQQQQLTQQHQINSFFDYSPAISDTENSNYRFTEPFQQPKRNLHSGAGFVTDTALTPMLTNPTSNLHQISAAHQRQATSSVSSSESSATSSAGTLSEEKPAQQQMAHIQQQRIKTPTTPVPKVSNPLNSLNQMTIKLENSSLRGNNIHMSNFLIVFF